MTAKKKLLIGLSTVLAAALLLVIYMMTLGAAQFRHQARKVRTVVQLDALKAATTNYVGVFGQWPATMNELSFNRSNIAFVSPAAPWNDGWGRPFNYIPPADSPGTIVSLGRDGLPGGSELDADLKVSLP